MFIFYNILGFIEVLEKESGILEFEIYWVGIVVDDIIRVLIMKIIKEYEFLKIYLLMD